MMKESFFTESLLTDQKSFHEQLNRSYSASNCFQSWTEYREQISRLCTQVVGLSLKKAKVTIVGAGQLNDISLKALTDASEINLIDIDLEAMQAGVNRQNLKDSTLIKYHPCDITGLDAVGFLDELAVLMGYKDLSGIERFLENTQMSIKAPVQPDSQDILVITPIYTQFLLWQFIELIKLSNLTNHYERLISKFLEFVARLVASVNEKLIETLKQGGKLIVWSDILEYHTAQPEYQVICKDVSSSALKVQIESYESQYGKGIGAYGIDHIAECVNHISEHFLVWPFDTQRHLLVKFISGVKTL